MNDTSSLPEHTYWYRTSNLSRVFSAALLLVVLISSALALAHITKNWTWPQRLLPLHAFAFALLYVCPACACAFYLSSRHKKEIGLYLVFGLILLASINYSLALLGLLRARFILGAWVLLWIPEIYFRFEFLRFCGSHLLSTFRSIWTGSYALIALVLLYSTWSSVGNFGSLYPATSCDVSLVHLILPKIYLFNHGLVDAWWTRGPFLPQLPHALFWGILSAGSRLFEPLNILPAFINSVACLFLAIVLAEWSGRLGNWSLALCLLLLVPVMRWSVGVAYLDVLNPLFVVSFGLACRHFVLTPSVRWGLVLGILASACLSNKHMGLMFIAPIGLISLLVLIVRLGKGQIAVIKNIVAPAIAAGVAFLPLFFLFFHRNFLVTGNPLFPFGKSSSENGYFWDQASIEGFRSAVSYWTKNNSVAGMFQTFLKFVTDFNTFSDTYDYPIGSFLLCLSLLSLIGVFCPLDSNSRLLQRRAQIAGLIVVLLQFGLWYFSSPVIRYLLPSVAICVALSMLAFSSRSIICRLLSLALVVGSAWYTESAGFYAPSTPPPLTRDETLAFVRKNVLSFSQSEWLAKNTPATSVVYSFFDSCSVLYYSRPVIGDWFGLANYGELASHAPDSIVATMRRYQVDYLLENRAQTYYPKFEVLIQGQEQCFDEVLEARSDYARLHKFRSDLQNCGAGVSIDPRIEDLKRKGPARILPFD